MIEVKTIYAKTKFLCQHIIFSFSICFILTNTQLNYAVRHPLFNCFRIYLCSIGRVRNASDPISLLFFRNSFFSVYRHSDLEGSCSNGTKTRHVNLVACGV
jgi:hypothetical protein